MTYKAVVSYISFDDNVLKSRIVEVEKKSFKVAIASYEYSENLENESEFHSDIEDKLLWIDQMPDDLCEIKKQYFDADSMVNVIWIDW
jgi:hypothetical protein